MWVVLPCSQFLKYGTALFCVTWLAGRFSANGFRPPSGSTPFEWGFQAVRIQIPGSLCKATAVAFGSANTPSRHKQGALRGML